MAVATTLVAAAGELTFTAAGTAADTVTIGARVYTLRAAVGTTANEVKIGANQTATAANLVAAINRAAGGGTTYGSNTTKHPSVKASSSGGVVTATAIIAGAQGNDIPVSEAGTSASWDAAFLGTAVAGSGDFDQFIEDIINLNQVNSEVQYELKKLTEVED